MTESHLHIAGTLGPAGELRWGWGWGHGLSPACPQTLSRAPLCWEETSMETSVCHLWPSISSVGLAAVSSSCRTHPRATWHWGQTAGRVRLLVISREKDPNSKSLWVALTQGLPKPHCFSCFFCTQLFYHRLLFVFCAKPICVCTPPHMWGAAPWAQRLGSVANRALCQNMIEERIETKT